MELLVPLLVALFLGVPVILVCARDLPRGTRELLTRYMLIGFALRVTLAFLYVLVPELRVFHQDAAGYENTALLIARYWSGDSGVSEDVLLHGAHNTGTFYFFAAILYVLGPYTATLSIVNAIFGTLSGLMLYRIGRYLFHEVIARRAAIIALFFPSLIIWSSMALKDSLVGLAILLTTLFCIRLRNRFSVANVFGVMVPILCIYPVRFYLVYFLLASVVGTMVINRSGTFIGSLTKQALLVGAMLLVVTAVGLTSNTRQDLEVFDLESVSNYRRGMAVTANSGFAQDVDVSTPAGALAFLPIGITSLLWSPFPWQMTSAHTLLTLPEMLFWWSCIPALLRGLRFALRKRFREVSPIIVFSATLLVGYSLAMGNIGAAYRMRAQVLPLMFLFASLGFYLEKLRARKLDDTLVVAEAAA